MPADVHAIMAQYAQLKQHRSMFEQDWDEIARTMLPAYSDIRTHLTPGSRRTRDIYDSTGMESLALLAGHLAGAVTNFQMSWFEMRMEYDPLNELQPVGAWLDACAKVMQDKMSSSTTPQSFHELYLQYAGFGTGCLFGDRAPLELGPRFAGLLVRSVPMGQYVITEDAFGRVDTLAREIKQTPRQAAQQFGFDALSETMRGILRNGHGGQIHEYHPFLHYVYPREDRDERREDQGNMAWASVYVDQTAQHIVSEGGYPEFPYLVPRWQKLGSWTPWGFGPGHLALPEVLTLNRWDQDLLSAHQMRMLPIGFTDDPDAVGRVRLLPGMMNPLAKGANLQWMPPPGDLNAAHHGMEERRQRIRSVFFVNQLMTLPPVDSSKMTAYEVAQRVGFMQRLMGPAFMRLLSELLNPFIDIVFQDMWEAGELPEPPDEVWMAVEAGAGGIKVDYEGPLARAQRSGDIEAIHGWIDIGERITQATGRTDHWDYVEADQIMQRSGKVLGVPAVTMTDKRQVMQIRQQRQLEAQALKQQQQMLATTQAVKDITPAAEALAGSMEGEAA